MSFSPGHRLRGNSPAANVVARPIENENGVDSEDRSDSDISMESDASEDIADPEDIKANICYALDNVRSAGEFAVFQPIAQGFNPGLDIQGLGPVGLSLSPRDTKAIVEICHRSPFGKGTKTLVDTSVRKCLGTGCFLV